MTVTILTGDCRDMLKTLPEQSVQMCVTSPPYFGLRDYQVDGQIGLELTPHEFVAAMVEVFREVRRVLRDDGTLWLNLGDSYAGSWGAQSRGGPPSDNSTLTGNGHIGGGPKISKMSAVQCKAHPKRTLTGSIPQGSGLKPKDLIGIPWRVAFALQADGWWLRQDIIWSKPNPMPESVTDRCTKAHEYIFLLSKSERYYFDQQAVAEPVADSTVASLLQPTLESQTGSPVPGKTNGNMKAAAPRFGGNKYGNDEGEMHRTKSGNEYVLKSSLRNRRSVWPITTKPFSEAHFATFPPELPELCIKAGSREGDTVLDPFFGAGTTGLVADRLHRNCIGIELNAEYVAMAKRRIAGDAPLFAAVTA